MKSFTFFRFLSKGNKTLFDIPVESQLDFLIQLGNPRDDFERSYYQYLSQQLFVAKWKNIVFNLSAFFLLPFTIVGLWLKGLFLKKGAKIDAIGEFKGIEEALPLCLNESYVIDNSLWRDGFSFCISDFPFLFHIFWRHQPYFILKSLLKVAQYSHAIKLHAPRAIIVHNEYSFTSSVLTAYCEQMGVKHINVMHGEKLFYIRDSFFRYHECYVWDTHYSDLFVRMKAEPLQFRIAIPPSMKIDPDQHLRKDVYADYKYFLANNSEDEVVAISRIMHEIKNKGNLIKIRLHPRYSDINIVKKYFDTSEIELPKEVNIIESISNLEFAIGSYSTVLVQAYLAGKKVVMDDVVLRDQYQKLTSMNYILAQKKNLKLSEL